MLLAIDAGNTNVVFAVYDGDRQLGSWRSATDVKRTADEYAVWLTQLMALKGLVREQIDRAIVATVVPEALFNLVSLCKRYFDSDPLVVGEPSVKLPVKALVDRPEEVGADRLVNSVAAAHRYQAPLIVVDFGTATTFDLVDRDGNYAGGVIAPGINLSLEALYLAAAKLPRVAIRRTEKVIATGTVSAMQSGVFWGYIGLIEGIVARMRTETGENLKVVATGGLAPMFGEATSVIDHVDGDLTLYGLVLINRLNQE
jgi:type III pantothenate kinase